MRGEKVLPPISSVGVLGSSPHARGKDVTTGSKNKVTRIIPACAGKSNKNFYPEKYLQDHPRMRGEKLTPSLPVN